MTERGGAKLSASNSPVSHGHTAGDLAMAAAPPAEFLERLLELVQKERAAEESESSLLLSNAPTSVLERSGLALGNLSGQTSVGLGGRLLIELSRPPAYHTSSAFPPHDFRPGDLARLKQQGAAGGSGRKAAKAASKDDKGKGKVQEEDGMDGVVYKTTSTKIVLAVDEPPDDFVLPERIQMWASDCRPGVKKLVADKEARRVNSIKVANPTTFVRQEFFLRRALRKLEAAEPLSPLLSVLLGQQKPTVQKRSDAAPLQLIDENLNDSQKEAVDFALSSEEVALIWGPPGTGVFGQSASSSILFG